MHSSDCCTRSRCCPTTTIRRPRTGADNWPPNGTDWSARSVPSPALRAFFAGPGSLTSRSEEHTSALPIYDADPAAADRRRQLATEWDGLVGQIRALPGFEGFLRRPRVADLRREAEAGPIIMVNIASHRSDALILTSDPRAPVRVVPLPGVT